MRICMWHGWLLEGTGSNVYTARTVEVLRREGHDVVLLCQEQHPESFGFVDAWGTVNHGVSALVETDASPAAGRCVVLRPQIGAILPVFVWDEYEGFSDVQTFVDLADEDLSAYLDANVTAMRAAMAWHGSEAVITGHAVPGAAVGARSAQGLPFVAKLHGSDLEYAIRLQDRYVELAREGLSAATTVVGSSLDVIDRARGLIPGLPERTAVVNPGVEVERFRPRPRSEALTRSATLLQMDPDVMRGHTETVALGSAAAALDHDPAALDRLAAAYDQTAPDPTAADVLGLLADRTGPLIGYLGKLIPQKGVERMIEAVALSPSGTAGVIVGFGTYREWLEALVTALDTGDVDTYAWLREHSQLRLELTGDQVEASRGLRDRLKFTGRLDHRYAPGVLAGLDVLVVPSTLAEAFGMVAAEAACAGAFPLVSRHSGLAEVADALESHVGEPGLFSFDPGDGATARVVEGLGTLLDLPAERAAQLKSQIRDYTVREWSWEGTADKLLAALG